MDLKEIKELLEIVNESGVAEFEIEKGDQTIRIRRNAAAEKAAQPPYIVVSGGAPAAASVAAADPMPAEAPPAAAPAAEATSEPDEDEDLVIVTSPIVGTFYASPQPDAPPFVQVGDTVGTGEVLCIIEAMKLMNEIESETAGVVAKKFVSDGQPVEYGEALFGIKAGG